jgi:hypothetical protein
LGIPVRRAARFGVQPLIAKLTWSFGGRPDLNRTRNDLGQIRNLRSNASNI